MRRVTNEMFEQRSTWRIPHDWLLVDMSHIWTRHITNMSQIWLIAVWNCCYICAMPRSHMYVWHDSFICVTLTAVCNRDVRHMTRVMSRIWMSHDTCMNESCHTYVTAVTRVCQSCRKCKWVMSHVCMSHVTHMTRVMTHLWMSHVTYMNVSWHTYEWIMSQIPMRHVIYANESCNTRKQFMSHTWIRHFTCMNESCHTYEWVMSHWNESCHKYPWGMSYMRMSHAPHTNESCHAYELVMMHVWISNKSVMSHIWMRHVTHISKSCHIYEWVMSDTHKWVMHHTRMSHVTLMNQ